MKTSVLAQPVTLPCGVVADNRFIKSATSEALASVHHAPTKLLERLYGVWSAGGAAVLVTGNVMIDSRHLGEPGNVVVEDEKHLSFLKSWAEAGTAHGNQLWMQLNHPGKQSQRLWNKEPVAPSAVPLSLKHFNPPRALTADEIEDIVVRFGRAAGVAKKAGFTGVQIHGAHGYLVSQFLSPHHNRRGDEFGGSLENRMRFLEMVYGSIREAVGPSFPVSIKINSADFQRGGFTSAESLSVIARLAEVGIDLIEISGGNYEAPAMMAQRKTTSERGMREAYFLKFAEKARQQVSIPLAVTGGFRTSRGMEAAIKSGAVDFVGMARPMILETDIPLRILQGEDFTSEVQADISTGFRALDHALMIRLTWYTQQLSVIAAGKTVNRRLHPLLAALQLFAKTGWQNFRRSRE
ncbi:MAG: NADH:flavin oxidoreductase/NADH oxidase family protein [Desulfocapsaceae bacterium]